MLCFVRMSVVSESPAGHQIKMPRSQVGLYCKERLCDILCKILRTDPVSFSGCNSTGADGPMG